MTMTWAIIAELLIKYTLPLAEKIWQKSISGNDPTQADWDELKALGAQTMESQVLAALARNGIALDSPKALEMLALIRK